jgi:S1-C subfamily serine protease
VTTVKEVEEQLIDGGSVQRAYLGITGGEITSQVASALNLPVDEGAMIEQVLDGGPADQAGIKGATGEATIGGQTFPVGGDIITKVDGEDVAGMDEVIAAVDDHKPGDELTLTIHRGDDQHEVTVELGERPSQVHDGSSQALP